MTTMRGITAALLFAMAQVWLVSSAGADGYYMTGNDALNACERNLAWCTGFVIGSADTVTATRSKDTMFCPPQGVTGGQLVDVFLKELRDRPDQRHMPAVFLLIEGFQRAFPC